MKIKLEKATWYLTTNLTGEQASLTEVIRLYGLRIWVEESYKRMKDELGWADFMVRSDRAIRRHWALVCCAFAFCWWHEAYRARVVDARTEMLSTPHQHPAVPVYPRWPKALRAVRAWLAPIHWFTRYWQAFFDMPPPDTLVHLISAFKGGRGINLYFST